ncbi:YbfB/YjiJ family MFS transporter [Alcaligenaceae bacterium CGII-47]|nr:YbfB/YjiJ family MFS transporter [Alcaligenaceae bacterium CGII-47]
MSLRSSGLALPLAGLLALAVAMGIGRFAFTPILPMMQADLGLSLADGGWLASANYLGYLLGALLATRIPWPPESMLRRGLWMVVIMTALMGLTGNWIAWLLWRMLAGIASAWVMIGTATLCIARLNAAGQSGRSGIVFAGVGCGVAFAGVVCMALALMHASSDQAWLLLACAALLGLIGAGDLWRHPAAQTTPIATGSSMAAQAPVEALNAPTQTLHNSIRHKDPVCGRLHWGLIWCYGIYGFGYILPATFLPAQARILVPDPLLFSLAWPIFGLAAAVSTILASRLLDRLNRRQIWALSHLVMATGVLMPVLFSNLAAIIVAAVCVGSTFMTITMVGLQEAQAEVGPLRAKVQIAAMTASFALGQFIGPLFFSFMHVWFNISLDAVLLIATASLILGAIPIMRDQSAR